MKRLRLIWLVAFLLGVTAGCSSDDNLAENTAIPANSIPTTLSISTPAPTNTPTLTPEPTNTQTPTAQPTLTPVPTSTPTPSQLPTSILNEETLIRQVLEEYRSALLQGDGKTAIQLVDSKTIDWYDQVLAFALTLERDDLDRLDFTEKFIVLRLRHEFSLDQLEDLIGEEVLIIGIERGWISHSSVESMELEDIEVHDLRGFVTFDEMIEPIFVFVKEDGQWKFMLWKLAALGNVAFVQLVEESGLTEDEFIIGILEALSSFQVDERIFDGPINY